jgi:hypothetical protein
MKVLTLVFGLLAAAALLRTATQSAGGQAKASKGAQQTRMNPNETHLRLVASLHGDWDGRLLPEQSALFDLRLLNEGSGAAEAYGLDQNKDTPVFAVFDGHGQALHQVTHRDMVERFVSVKGEPGPEKPVLTQIPPGKSKGTFVDLWTYMDPLPKGSYQFGASHLIQPGSDAQLESNRVPFEIADASVSDAALGYTNNRRNSSVLLWVAAPAGSGSARLLGRLSALDSHSRAMVSGCALGPADPRSLVAIGGKPKEGTPTGEGWFAITHDDSVELVQHFEAHPQWRSGPVALGIGHARPVPGFPDRRHALFLATGTKPGGGAALAGVSAVAKEGVKTKWVTPLLAEPALSACLFGLSGAVKVAFGVYRSGSTRIWSIEVDESGNVLVPQAALHSSPNQLLALIADQRPGQVSGFLVLESDPSQPDRPILTRLPVGGKEETVKLEAVPGWPHADGKPLPAQRIHMETGWDGKPRIAFVTATGQYFAGLLDGSPLMQGAPGVKGNSIPIPLIAALEGGVTYSGFTDRGYLVYFGGR